MWPFDTRCHFLLVVLWKESISLAVFEILLSKRIGVMSLTFQGHVTSSVTWPFDCPYAISYWCSFGIKPLSLTVSEILRQMLHNGWRDLDTTSKQRSRSFILVPIDFSYTTSYRLSIVTFALALANYCLATIHNVTDDDRRTQHCSMSATSRFAHLQCWTRKLCYSKDDRAMRAI